MMVHFIANLLTLKFKIFPLANANNDLHEHIIENRSIKSKAMIKYEIWMNKWHQIIDQIMLLTRPTPKV